MCSRFVNAMLKWMWYGVVLQHEVSICRKEQPFVIDITAHQRSLSSAAAPAVTSPAVPAVIPSRHTSIASMLSEALADPPTNTVPTTDVTQVPSTSSTVGAMDLSSTATGAVNEGASTSKPVVNELVKLPNGKCEYRLLHNSYLILLLCLSDKIYNFHAYNRGNPIFWLVVTS